MLKLRIITTSILLPLFTWLLIFASNTVFLSTTAIIVSLAAFEWLKLIKTNKLINFILLLICLAIIYDIMKNNKWILHSTSNIYFIVKIACVFWFIAFLKILLFSFKVSIFKSSIFKYKLFSVLRDHLMFLFFIIFGLIPSWLAINYLKIHNKYLLAFACVIIIAADIGAYIFGKFFGKHKLTIISPGKTWEGIFGGYISSLLVAVVYLKLSHIDLNILNLNYLIILKIIFLTTITFIFSVVGDLFESLLKREAFVKDSGNLLPGHGGILDRIDSFCSGIPAFLLGFLVLDKYII